MRRPSKEPSEARRSLIPPELIERCKEGDQAAWSELVQATHREVYTLCFRILGDQSDATEATQDAYVKVWRGLASFRGEALFTTWLYRVATNAAISKQRSRKRRRLREESLDTEEMARVASRSSTEAEAEVRMDTKALEQALASLPDHYRSAVLLRDVYGLGIADIAEQLKISETAAKVRVHRGRKLLKDKVFVRSDEVE